jgi:hypothetical protein
MCALCRTVAHNGAGARSGGDTSKRARLKFHNFETVTAWSDTGCWQHEWEAGMAEPSHMLAIFMQQLCSASLMVRPGVRQTAIGSPRSTGIRRPATIFEALLNIVILSTTHR